MLWAAGSGAGYDAGRAAIANPQLDLIESNTLNGQSWATRPATSTSLGVDFISRLLDEGSRCQASPIHLAAVSGGLVCRWRGAQSGFGWRWRARETGVVEVYMQPGSFLFGAAKWHVRQRDAWSGEWRAIAPPHPQAPRQGHACAAMCSLLFVTGGFVDHHDT